MIRNIFPLIQQSEMVISCLSTAAIEAYGLGKKTLFCNFTGTDLYHQDIDDSILTKTLPLDSPKPLFIIEIFKGYKITS